MHSTFVQREDQANIEKFRDFFIRHFAVDHEQKVCCMSQIIVSFNEIQTFSVTIEVGYDRRNLRDDVDDVRDIFFVIFEIVHFNLSANNRNHGLKHGHRMCVLRKAFQCRNDFWRKLARRFSLDSN